MWFIHAQRMGAVEFLNPLQERKQRDKYRFPAILVAVFGGGLIGLWTGNIAAMLVFVFLLYGLSAAFFEGLFERT